MSKLAILCVDDEKIVLDSLKEQLRAQFESDVMIETAESGMDALEIIEELAEDDLELGVIISDQIMPEMKGDELLKAVHEMLPRTLKILLTGQADAQAVGNAVNSANLYRYIAKPWQATDLVLTVKEALRSYKRDKQLEEQNLELQHINEALESLNRAYERFVPREFVSLLSRKSIIDVKLGDQVSKEMTVMFSDIRSFTTMSESMTPAETFGFINSYLRHVAPVIREAHGLIVKYLGDGLMAVFPNGADNAMQASIRKLEKVAEYNEQLRQLGQPTIRVGIGLHMGHLMVGMVGETVRIQPDILSDSVNLTARLEGLTKFYGASLVISEATLHNLSNPDQYQTRFLDRVIVKGRSEPISIYEILDGLPPAEATAKLETRADFEAGIRHYQARHLDQAQHAFEQVNAANPNDEATVLYLHRINRMVQDGIPTDWNGITNLTEK